MAALDADFYDELVDADGQPRPHARTLVAALEALGPEALTQAGQQRDAIFMQQGITFDAGGAGHRAPCKDRPFPLDLVPRIIPADEWTQIKRGLAQRIRALNHFVDDVYHAREIIHDGKVPWQLVVSRPAFARAAHGIRPPGGVYCHVSGCDLVRDANGAWKVLEDNVRTPSGISYVLENRRAMTRLLPGAVRALPRAARRPLPGAAPDRAGRGRADGRGGGGDRRRLDAGAVQLRLLRARVPGAADGRGARRGVRPGRARRGLPHPHHARAAARARDLPPDRRRLHGSAGVPAGLGPGRPRADARVPGGVASRSSTPSARASPTTRRSTTTCRR